MKKSTQGKVYMGTSNIVVPGTKASFPEVFRQKSRLHYYGTLFNSLEINSCFYKVPMFSTFQKWAADVPDHFRFTVKLWKGISHVKALKFDPQHIHQFMQAAAGIGEKKGCLLLQFPGKISMDYYNQVEGILENLHQAEPALQWPVAVEFRNPGWYVRETADLLKEYGATMVLHDQPKAKNIYVENKADKYYLRFHGPEGNYRGSYSDAFLKEQAARINEWKNNGSTVYVYFNNTMGDALHNAQHLQKLIGGNTKL